MDLLSEIPRELIQETLSNLLVVDQLNLGITATYYNTIVNKQLLLTKYCNKIDNWINKVFDQKSHLFKEFLNISGSVLTGSKIIQEILSETYDGCGVDIIVPTNTPNPGLKLLEHLCLSLDTRLYNKLYSEQYIIKDKYYIKYEGVKIRFTIVESLPIDYIDGCNLNIARNYYSVNGLHSHLTVCDLRGIVEKRIRFRSIDKYDEYELISKYAKYGFKILDNTLETICALVAGYFYSLSYFSSPCGQTAIVLPDDEYQSYLSNENAYDCTDLFDCPIANFYTKKYKHRHTGPRCD
jgi:hypothetical protein